MQMKHTMRVDLEPINEKHYDKNSIMKDSCL